MLSFQGYRHRLVSIWIECRWRLFFEYLILTLATGWFAAVSAASDSDSSQDQVRVAPEVGWSDSANSLALASEVGLLAVGGSRQLSIFNISNGREISRIQTFEGPVDVVGIDPERQRVLTLSMEWLEVHDWGSKSRLYRLRDITHACAGKGFESVTLKRWRGSIESVSLKDLKRIWAFEINRAKFSIGNMACSSDGSTVVVITREGVVQVLDGRDGRPVSEWSLPPGTKRVDIDAAGKHTEWNEPMRVRKAVLSGDGRVLGLIDDTGVARILKTDDGREVLTYAGDGPKPGATSLSFSAKGDLLSVAWYAGAKAREGGDGRITVFQLSSRQNLREVKAGLLGAKALVFSNDESKLFFGATGEVGMWEQATGALKMLGIDRGSSIFAAASSADGRYLATVSRGRSLQIWDMQAGQRVRSVAVGGDALVSVIWSQDGRRLITGARDGTITFWDRESGKSIGLIHSGHGFETLRMSADGSRLLSVHNGMAIDKGLGVARLWKVPDKQQLREYAGLDRYEPAADISADGQHVALAMNGARVVVKEIDSDRELSHLDGPKIPERSLSSYLLDPKRTYRQTRLLFSSTGQTLAIGGQYFIGAGVPGPVELEILNYGKPGTRSTFMEPTGGVNPRMKSVTGEVHDDLKALSWSSDGSQILVAGENSFKVIGLVDGGRSFRKLHNSARGIRGAHFSAHRKSIVVVDDEGRISFHEQSDGRLIAQFFQMADDGWIALTPEGYFNASSFAAADGLTVLKGSNAWAMSDFWEMFYRPDLVRNVFQGQRITSEIGGQTFEEALRKPPPHRLSIVPVRDPTLDARTIQLQVMVEDAGGGIGDVRVALNGKVISRRRSVPAVDATKADSSLRSGDDRPEPCVVLPDGRQCVGKLEVSLISGEENEVSVLAFNASNSIQSSPATWIYRSKLPPDQPRLWVLAVGINEFSTKQSVFQALKNASKDAADFSEMLEGAGNSFFGTGRILPASKNRRLLLDLASTRRGILERMHEISQHAKPHDTVVWFFASHGTLDKRGHFAVVPSDAGCLDSNCEQLGPLLTAEDLMEQVEKVAALRQLLVLDTCHAGAIDETLSRLYDARFSVLAKRAGMHVFAAAHAAEHASDGKHGGNGYFTSQLLAGLHDRQADEDGNGVLLSVELGRYARYGGKPASDSGSAERAAFRLQDAQLSFRAVPSRQTPMILLIGQDFGLARVTDR